MRPRISAVPVQDLFAEVVFSDSSRNQRMQDLFAGLPITVEDVRKDRERIDFLQSRVFGDRAILDEDEDPYTQGLEYLLPVAANLVFTHQEWNGGDPQSFRDALGIPTNDYGWPLNQDPNYAEIVDLVNPENPLLLNLSAEDISAAMQFHCAGLPGEAKVIARKDFDSVDANGNPHHPKSMRDVAAVIDAMQMGNGEEQGQIISFPYFDDFGQVAAVTIDSANGLVLFNSSISNSEVRAKAFSGFKDRFMREVVPSLMKKFGVQKAMWEVGIQEVPAPKSSVEYLDHRSSGVHCVLNAALDLLRIRYRRGDFSDDLDFLEQAKRVISQVTGEPFENIEGDDIEEVLIWVGLNVFESRFEGQGSTERIRDKCYNGEQITDGEQIRSLSEALIKKQNLQKRVLVAAKVTERRSTLFSESKPLSESHRGLVSSQDSEIAGVAPGLDPASYRGLSVSGDGEHRAYYTHFSDFEMIMHICLGIEVNCLDFYRKAAARAENLRTGADVTGEETAGQQAKRKTDFFAAIASRDKSANQAFIFCLLREGYEKAEESYNALAKQAEIDPSFVLCDDNGNPLQDRAAVNDFFRDRALQFVPEKYHKDAIKAMGFVAPVINGRWEKGLAGQQVDDLIGKTGYSSFEPSSLCSKKFLELNGGYDSAPVTRPVLDPNSQTYFHFISELAAQGLVRLGWLVYVEGDGPIAGINPFNEIPFCTPKDDSRNFTIIVPKEGEPVEFEEKMIRFEVDGNVLVLNTGKGARFMQADETLLEQIQAIVEQPELLMKYRTGFMHQKSGRLDVVSALGEASLEIAPDTSYGLNAARRRRLETVDAPAFLPEDAEFSSPGRGVATTLTLGANRRKKAEAKEERKIGFEPEKIVVRGDQFRLGAGTMQENNRHLLRKAEFLRVIFDGATSGPVNFGDADISHASFRGCEFLGVIDFSQIDAKVFKTISFANCKGLENIICPGGVQLVEEQKGDDVIVAKAADVPEPGTEVTHPVAVAAFARKRVVAGLAGRGRGGSPFSLSTPSRPSSPDSDFEEGEPEA